MQIRDNIRIFYCPEINCGSRRKLSFQWGQTSSPCAAAPPMDFPWCGWQFPPAPLLWTHFQPRQISSCGRAPEQAGRESPVSMPCCWPSWFWENSSIFSSLAGQYLISKYFSKIFTGFIGETWTAPLPLKNQKSLENCLFYSKKTKKKKAPQWAIITLSHYSNFFCLLLYFLFLKPCIKYHETYFTCCLVFFSYP